MAHNQMPCTQLHNDLSSLPRYYRVLSDLMTPACISVVTPYLISLFQHASPTSLAFQSIRTVSVVIFFKNEVNIEILCL